MANDRSVGSTSVKQDGGAGKKKLGWLPWALLAAGLLALAIFLVLRNSGDEGDDPGVDATDESSNSPDEGGDVGSSGGDTGEELTDGGDGTSGDGEDGSTGGDDGSGSGSGSGSTGGSTATTGGSTGGGTTGGSGGGQAGTVTSEGTAILPTPAGGLATYSGKAAQARSVPVQSVVADEGFWVGTSETDRIFVFFAADNAGTESRVQVEEGQTISFDGMVKPIPADFATAFEVDADEGADQLEQQGQYIEIAPDAITQG